MRPLEARTPLGSGGGPEPAAPMRSFPLQISASIVLYQNDPAQVLAAARSVLGSGLRVGLTLVDNSPSGSLRETAETAGADYVFAGRNLGFGAAHNIAIDKYMALSECHLLLNPDVYFDPAILGPLYSYMQGHAEVGMAMPRVLYPDGSEQHLCKLLPHPYDLVARRFGGPVSQRLSRARMSRYHLKGFPMAGPTVVPSLSGCFMLLRTSLLRTVGVFDERYFMYLEDVDLCRRIGGAALTAFYPGVAIFHGYAKGSYKDKRLLQHHMTSARKYFSKWGWLRDGERDRLNARAGTPIREASAREAGAREAGAREAMPCAPASREARP